LSAEARKARLTEEEIESMRRDFLSWMELEGIPIRRYKNTLEVSFEELRHMTGRSKEEVEEKARALLNEFRERILKAERMRGVKVPSVKMPRIPTAISPVPKIRTFKVGQEVRIVTSPDALGPDPHEGKIGVITDAKYLGNQWIYTIRLETGEVIYRQDSNLMPLREMR